MNKKIDYIGRKTKENIKKYFNKIFSILQQPEMAVLPGQLAFVTILSVVPIITLICYAVSFFNVNSSTVTDLIISAFPGNINIAPMFEGTKMDIKLVLILIWMFYIASNGFNSVIIASNEIYGIKQSTFIKRRIKALIMTLTFVLMLIIILLIPVFGNKILDLFNLGEVEDKILSIYNLLKIPITWLIMFIFIRTIYEFSPDRMRKKVHVNTGALFTSVGWVIVTFIYSNLANNMDGYNVIYGTLSSIAFLMLWLYFMSFIFVVGISLNYGQENDQEIMAKTGAVKVIK